jgi:hypothetical protein
MRNIWFFAAVFALAGCATGPSLQSRMAAYIGASGETLVQNLGVPDKQITLNGVQYLAYIREQTTVLAPPPLFFGGYGYGGFYRPYGGFYASGLPATVQVWRCDITFMLHADKVVSFTLRGNYCN